MQDEVYRTQSGHDRDTIHLTTSQFSIKIIYFKEATQRGFEYVFYAIVFITDAEFIDTEFMLLSIGVSGSLHRDVYLFKSVSYSRFSFFWCGSSVG